MGRRFSRKSFQSVAQPPENSKGGRIRVKIHSGSMRSCGTLGTKANKPPPITNAIG